MRPYTTTYRIIYFKRCLVILMILISSKQHAIQPNFDLNKQTKDGQVLSSSNKMSYFQMINQKLENLDNNFITQFSNFYTQNKISALSTKKQIGQYLFLMGKMHLYNVLPQQRNQSVMPSYLLGYHYLKSAAEKYQNSEAYYYLAVIQYLKIVPTFLLHKNIENYQNKFMFKNFMQLREMYIQDLKIRHQHNIQHNLYLSTLLGHTPAALSLGYMLKQGIATAKNCTSALGYYLLALKKDKVDIFQLPSQYIDAKNFEDQLYYYKKNSNTQDMQQKQFNTFTKAEILKQNLANYDIETILQFGLNYLYGYNGYRINHEIAFNILYFIKDDNQRANMLIRFMYLHGKGTKKDTKLARQMFMFDSNPISQQIYVGFEYFGIGLEQQNQALIKIKKEEARKQMQYLYNQFTNFKQNLEQQITDPTEYMAQLEQSNIIKTSLIKYLIGSLVLSGQVQGQKEDGIYLIQSAAKAGNTLALSHMGLIFLEGADLSYDCQKSLNYFSSQAYSHQFFQTKLSAAIVGINKNKIMFSLIKYTQMMMIGYPNSFVNALYLLQVYKDSIYSLNSNPWSLTSAKNNTSYRSLVSNKVIPSLESILSSQCNANSEQIFTSTNLEILTRATNQALQQYINYAKLKVTTIGIQLHGLTPLKLAKYKKNNDIYLLHDLANSNIINHQVKESQYILGKYYQQSNISGTQEQKKMNRAYRQYYRATRDQLISKLLFIFNDNVGYTSQTKVVQHFTIFITVIFVTFVLCQRKRNQNFQKIINISQIGQIKKVDNINNIKNTTKNENQIDSSQNKSTIKYSMKKQNMLDKQKIQQQQDLIFKDTEIDQHVEIMQNKSDTPIKLQQTDNKEHQD